MILGLRIGIGTLVGKAKSAYILVSKLLITNTGDQIITHTGDFIEASAREII